MKTEVEGNDEIGFVLFELGKNEINVTNMVKANSKINKVKKKDESGIYT